MMSGTRFSQEVIKQTEMERKRLVESVGRIFDKHKRGFRELGLDVALDNEGRPWILEVNTRPQFYPLKDLKNKQIYNRILSNAKDYGRKR